MSLKNVRVEVRPDPETLGDAGAGDHLTEDLSNRVDEVGDAIIAIADRFASKLDVEANTEAKAATWRLAEVEIGLSLDLEAEAGVVIARVGTKAGFHVNIKWTHGSE